MTNHTQWICLIGSSEQGVLAARRCGFSVGLCADGGEMSQEAAMAVTLATPVDLRDLDTIRRGIKRLVASLGLPRAVVSFREHGVLPAAILSNELGLPGNPVEVVEAIRDKGMMRRAFLSDPLLSLPYREGQAEDVYNALINDVDAGPWILKPTDGTGSCGITLVANRTQLDSWLARTQFRDGDQSRWLLEPYIQGPEYSVEGVTFAGQHYFLGITAKETGGNAGAVEVGHSFPAQLPRDIRHAIATVVHKALSRLGVRCGASHTEVRLDARSKRPIIIETHTRPGGDCIPELVALTTGQSQYDLALRSLFSDVAPAEIRQPKAPSSAAAIRFLTPPVGKLTGVIVDDEPLLQAALRWRLDRRLLDPIGALDSSDSRSGYVIHRGRDATEAKAKAFAAAAAIRFAVSHGIER